MRCFQPLEAHEMHANADSPVETVNPDHREAGPSDLRVGAGIGSKRPTSNDSKSNGQMGDTWRHAKHKAQHARGALVSLDHWNPTPEPSLDQRSGPQQVTKVVMGIHEQNCSPST